MSAHTPSPWTVVPSSDGVSSQARTSDGRFSIYLGSTGAPAEEWQANARLIAAAPELLDALRRAERVMTDADLDHEPADDEARLTLDAVRAAIAKAEAPS